jgi:hypothetical protein
MILDPPVPPVPDPEPLAEVERRPHPAKFSPEILLSLRNLLGEEARRQQIEHGRRPLLVLDPFAGVGRIHELRRTGRIETLGLEIEPEWAHAWPGRTICTDAIEWMHYATRGAYRAHAIVTSVAYGNRLADCHEARDGSDRRSYRHDLGRMPTEGSSAVMPWGRRYWQFHGQAYRLMLGVAAPGALFALNVSNFYRGKELVHAVEWHRGAAYGAGWLPANDTRDRLIQTRRLRGVGSEATSARAEGEHVLVFRSPT